MLRMCRHIFVSGKDFLLDSEFCNAKGIIELKTKGVHTESLIKKWRCWPKEVPGDLIDTHFEDKEGGDIWMAEFRTENNKLFKRFCMKEPDYVTKIMASWITLDKLEGARKIRYFIDSSGTKNTKQFTYRQKFGINFRCRHQVYDHNNQRHALIYL